MFKLNWKQGRQVGGYSNLKIFSSAFLKADCYIIKYPEGSEIPIHTDPVQSGEKHYQINFVFWRPEIGGRFICKDVYRFGNRLFFFRPDIMSHKVSKIMSGTRYVFSLGWIQ